MLTTQEKDPIYNVLLEMWKRGESVDTVLLLCPFLVDISTFNANLEGSEGSWLTSILPQNTPGDEDSAQLLVHRCLLYSHTRYVALLAKYTPPPASPALWYIDLRPSGIALDTMLAVMYCLYSGHLPPLSFHSFPAVQECAAFLQTEIVLRECDAFVRAKCSAERALYFWCHGHYFPSLQADVMHFVLCTMARFATQVPQLLGGLQMDLLPSLRGMEKLIEQGMLMAVSPGQHAAYLTGTAYWMRLEEIIREWMREVGKDEEEIGDFMKELAVWRTRYKHLPCLELDPERFYLFPDVSQGFEPPFLTHHMRSQASFVQARVTFHSVSQCLADLTLTFNETNGEDAYVNTIEDDSSGMTIELQRHEVIVQVDKVTLSSGILALTLYTSEGRTLRLSNPSANVSPKELTTATIESVSLSDIREKVCSAAAHLHSLWLRNGRLYLIWACLDEKWMLDTFASIATEAGLPNRGLLKQQKRQRIPCA